MGVKKTAVIDWGFFCYNLQPICLLCLLWITTRSLTCAMNSCAIRHAPPVTSHARASAPLIKSIYFGVGTVWPDNAKSFPFFSCQGCRLGVTLRVSLAKSSVPSRLPSFQDLCWYTCFYCQLRLLGGIPIIRLCVHSSIYLSLECYTAKCYHKD